MKAGWKTTEFWMVVAAAVLSVAVAAGYIGVEQSQQISDAVAQVINAVAALVAALAPVVGAVAYVWSRTKIKTNGK